MRLKNLSGETLNIPALGSPGYPFVVEADGEFDVPDDHAETGDDGKPVRWGAELFRDVTPKAKQKAPAGKDG
jgi:hypothetical protein